jgi:hypothetical protein
MKSSRTHLNFIYKNFLLYSALLLQTTIACVVQEVRNASTVRYGTVWYGMVRYGTVKQSESKGTVRTDKNKQNHAFSF